MLSSQQWCWDIMIPLKYSNFLLAATAALPVLSSPFVAPVYVIISLAFLYSNCWSCKMCFQISEHTDYWTYSFHVVSSNLLILSVFGEVYHFGILVCLRKIGIVMGGRHNFPWSKHLITCVLANSKWSVSVCCSCNLIYSHSNTKHVVNILSLSLA